MERGTFLGGLPAASLGVVFAGSFARFARARETVHAVASVAERLPR